MPVWKYRSFEEAREALWTDSSDPDLPRRIGDLWECVREMSGWTSPRGVLKFRSIEEANEEREARTLARVQALQEKRRQQDG